MLSDSIHFNRLRTKLNLQLYQKWVYTIHVQPECCHGSALHRWPFYCDTQLQPRHKRTFGFADSACSKRPITHYIVYDGGQSRINSRKSWTQRAVHASSAARSPSSTGRWVNVSEIGIPAHPQESEPPFYISLFLFMGVSLSFQIYIVGASRNSGSGLFIPTLDSVR